MPFLTSAGATSGQSERHASAGASSWYSILTGIVLRRCNRRLSARFVESAGRAVQMHHQSPRFVDRQITRPVDDEFLGSRIEIG
jgi:hypothetical protein